MLIIDKRLLLDYAIARARPRRRYNFIRGAIIYDNVISMECSLIIYLSPCSLDK